jgi:hypothetical protein
MPDWLAALVIEGSMDARHDPLDEMTAPEGFDKGALTPS